MNQDLEELIPRNRVLEAEVQGLPVFKEYANTGVLTEVPNRRCYFERLTQEVARARRNAQPLIMALVDLDDFKALKDRVGHKAGERVLQSFAHFLRANLRQEDVVCRLGGNEFALLLPDTPAQNAKALLEQIRQKLDRIELSFDGSDRYEVTFSYGLASYQSGLLAEDLMEEADHSLFAAKTRGWNRVIAAAVGRGQSMAQRVQ